MTEFVASNGAFPTAAQLVELGITDDAAGAVQKAATIGTITQTSAVDAATGVVTGTLSATLNTTGINAALQGQIIALAYNSQTGSWVCGTDLAAADYQLVPSECRRAIAAAVTAAAP
ncbi:pilin [Stutzerimonas stutzeri]|nr:pilin [Stutzerimonas stutzeri]